MKTRKKVWVGLSGGVDSAVSAALLKKRGYEVTGVFIKIWSAEFLECTWREDRLNAMRVAVSLGIPFKEIDLSQEYRERVVSDMLEQYKNGRTPNPDVLCNEFIKFGAFTEWAYENGADFVATGHYAQIQKRGGGYVLLKGVDAGKDQTYFLYRLKESDLARLIFPVGEYKKSNIREMARSFGLPNAERPDSQGLCFVGDVSMHEFLSRFITLKKGPLLDEEKVIIGEHDGAALYTIGQRHGFRLSSTAPKGPYYVTQIESERNLVHISRKKTLTEHVRAKMSDIHWLNTSSNEVEAVVRYHSRPVHAHIEQANIIFETPVLLTPGQSVVFYRDETCLGGAVIHSVA